MACSLFSKPTCVSNESLVLDEEAREEREAKYAQALANLRVA